jgi:hypothetical protein
VQWTGDEAIKYLDSLNAKYEKAWPTSARSRSSAVRRTDRIAAVLLLALGVGYAATAARSYTYWGAHGPGPASFPFWLGVAMAVLAVCS